MIDQSWRVRPLDGLEPLEDVGLSVEACRVQIGACNLQNGIFANDFHTGDRGRPGTIPSEVLS